MTKKKKILVAPLNRGLGHATRCIPIIEALENHGFEPIIASDGDALTLLAAEFPHVTALELPAYPLEYAGNNSFTPKLLTRMHHMLIAVKEEKKAVQQIVEKYDIAGIISDSRPGAYSKKVPSVFITHQLRLLTGNIAWFSTKVHRMFMRKYTECWVPDVEGAPNLSGKIGHIYNDSFNLKYIGPLSRIHKKPLEKKYNIMVLLSGPEPQRVLIEEKLKNELKDYKGRVLFVCGVFEAELKTVIKGNITFCNFLKTDALEEAFNVSDLILCQSGYSTIMDLSHLGKKTFFIPTPNDHEQEYLAKKLKKTEQAHYMALDKFKIEDLRKSRSYKGLKQVATEVKWKDLFSLFESE